MAVPRIEDLRKPLLEIMDGAKEDIVPKQYIRKKVIERLSLTNDDILEKVPSGGQTKFDNRVGWTLYELKKVGFLQSPSRAYYQITPQGKELLATGADYLLSLPWNALLNAVRQGEGDVDSLETAANDDVSIDSEDSTPDEQIAALYQELSDRLAEELLERVKQVSPDSFERLVVNLLEKMGYGQGQAIGGSGDGGIDGIINQDALGLEKVYIQAKRWENPVGEPEIRNFSGSLEAKGANKGVFITSSSFGPRARETARFISAGNKFIRLIDGEELARLMINHGVGVVSEIIYDVKKLDENYFAEDM
ncbi:MAG: restriction endonuclease [Gemmatimonadetes bacterium]|nr:restriction endonuclease [Gemmatimonadota bacterium]